MRVSVFAASALCIALLTGSGHAQVSATSSSQFAPLPSVGFVPPYEIARNVRRAGFEPLAPPMREGSTYVVRATDFRGILMRVVVDARSGAIRDVNRIVPGPGSYGQQVGMMPYGMGPDGVPPAYGQPADYDQPPGALDDGEMLGRPSATHPLTRASVTVPPPLPRPRPPELASRKPMDDAKAIAAKPATDSKSNTLAAETKSPEKPDANVEVTGSSAPARAPATAMPSAPPATVAAKPATSLAPPPIND
ncbi:MAG: hypothetical protein WA837_19380 [Xanthobacteraceae bacterium]